MMSSIIEAILSDFQFVTYSGNVKIDFDQSVSENQKQITHERSYI
jgi:hypothetical protein